eukprot:scaffold43284_cov18-Tisochrysis_lutea.AAC.1
MPLSTGASRCVCLLCLPEYMHALCMLPAALRPAADLLSRTCCCRMLDKLGGVFVSVMEHLIG